MKIAVRILSQVKLSRTLMVAACCLAELLMPAQSGVSDSYSGVPKHYFNSVFLLDVFAKPSVKLDTAELGSKLGSYGLRQYNFSFYTPLWTKDYKGYGRDSNITANSHLLLTGNFLTLQPVFNNLKQHSLTKRGVGLRYIYNNGKKSVWFFDLSPFVTRDATIRSSKVSLRFASTAIYSYNPNYWFNFRIGYTRLFTLGNRVLLPFVGLRFGRLDKVNLSIQFPRSINFTVPLGASWALALYSRPQGGVFNYANSDTLYPKRTTAVIHFTRFEINSGIRTDYKIDNTFHCYLGLGVSTRNSITFYSEDGNKGRARLLPYDTYFYTTNPGPAYFVQFGLIARLGKTKSVYNNKNIYDAIDINNKTDIHDNNPQIPIAPKKLPGNLEAISDLMDVQDY